MTNEFGAQSDAHICSWLRDVTKFEIPISYFKIGQKILLPRSTGTLEDDEKRSHCVWGTWPPLRSVGLPKGCDRSVSVVICNEE